MVEFNFADEFPSVSELIENPKEAATICFSATTESGGIYHVVNMVINIEIFTRLDNVNFTCFRIGIRSKEEELSPMREVKPVANPVDLSGHISRWLPIYDEDLKDFILEDWINNGINSLAKKNHSDWIQHLKDEQQLALF